MRTIAAVLLAVAVFAAGQGKQTRRTFSGWITDEMCATGDHSRMKMGPTDHECTIACVLAHGSLYVLTDGRNVYPLSDQKAPETFAGQRVTVSGVWDGSELKVESMSAAK